MYGLDISPYVDNNDTDKNIYDLSSVTIHLGDINSGHYVVARKMKDTWRIFDDSRVIPIKENNIDIGNAYYLVYKRR